MMNGGSRITSPLRAMPMMMYDVYDLLITHVLIWWKKEANTHSSTLPNFRSPDILHCYSEQKAIRMHQLMMLVNILWLLDFSLHYIAHSVWTLSAWMQKYAYIDYYYCILDSFPSSLLCGIMACDVRCDRSNKYGSITVHHSASSLGPHTVCHCWICRNGSNIERMRTRVDVYASHAHHPVASSSIKCNILYVRTSTHKPKFMSALKQNPHTQAGQILWSPPETLCSPLILMVNYIKSFSSVPLI